MPASSLLTNLYSLQPNRVIALADALALNKPGVWRVPDKNEKQCAINYIVRVLIGSTGVQRDKVVERIKYAFKRNKKDNAQRKN